MDKLIRDGKVAVLYSPGWGAGWYSWHGVEELLYDPSVVSMLESKSSGESILAYCHEKYGEDAYFGGIDDLTIEWVPIGREFVIREEDGSESIEYKDEISWHVA